MSRHTESAQTVPVAWPILDNQHFPGLVGPDRLLPLPMSGLCRLAAATSEVLPALQSRHVMDLLKVLLACVDPLLDATRVPAFLCELRRAFGALPSWHAQAGESRAPLPISALGLWGL